MPTRGLSQTLPFECISKREYIYRPSTWNDPQTTARFANLIVPGVPSRVSRPDFHIRTSSQTQSEANKWLRAAMGWDENNNTHINTTIDAGE